MGPSRPTRTMDNAAKNKKNLPLRCQSMNQLLWHSELTLLALAGRREQGFWPSRCPKLTSLKPPPQGCVPRSLAPKEAFLCGAFPRYSHQSPDFSASWYLELQCLEVTCKKRYFEVIILREFLRKIWFTACEFFDKLLQQTISYLENLGAKWF